jgi:hypothetical protein
MRKAILTAAVVAVGAVIAPLGASADHRPGHNPGTGNAGDPTIAATPNPILFGRSTMISGGLKGSDVAGKTIELQHDPFPFGTTYETIATTTTNADGDYSFKVSPGLNTNYRTVAKLDPEQMSPNVQVGVRMRITRRVDDYTPNVGQEVTFTGTVKPAHDGRTVYIQRRNSEGEWRTKATTTLDDAPEEAGNVSTYSRDLRISRDGVYRVKVNTHGDHLGNKTRRVRLDVP